MPSTIAALFDDAGRAEEALQALITAGLTGHRTALIRPEIHATELTPFRDPASGQAALGPEGSALPLEDRAAFEAGLRRGGAVLIADIVRDPEEAARIVETFGPADLDGRTEALRHGAAGSGAGEGVDVGAPLGAGLTAGMGLGNTNLDSLPGAGMLADDPSTLGTADLRADEMSTGNGGRSAVPTGGRRAEARAGAPGVRELRARSRVRVYGT
jgi:hypothetical protein